MQNNFKSTLSSREWANVVIAMTYEAISADPQMHWDIGVARLTTMSFRYPQSQRVAGDVRAGTEGVARV